MNEKSTDEILRILMMINGENLRLHFSTGIDSLATWLTVRDAGFKVVPIYFYLVPELVFVERTIAYYEDFFQMEIIRLPHPVLEKRLHCCDWQDAIGYMAWYYVDWPSRESFHEIGEHYMKEIGLPDKWTVIGVRAADSLSRRMVMKKHGELRQKEKVAFPLAWWKKRDVDSCLMRHGVKKSVDYELFGRSFDGLDYRFLNPISQRFPDDYKKILEWFPFTEAELLRGEWFDGRYQI
jgi:3'-phosphoadenosine 5'-phosphosulfate sulfotransferase (PAPS reductase)/FAD synthetase